MRVIVRDGCGSQTLPHTALTLELGDSTFYRWECPLCYTERWGRVSDVVAGILAGRGVKALPPLTETEIDLWVKQARRHHFLAAVK